MMHPLFETILDNFCKPKENEIIDHLAYASYKTQRDLGVSHEVCMKWGFGNEAMKTKYDKQPGEFT